MVVEPNAGGPPESNEGRREGEREGQRQFSLFVSASLLGLDISPLFGQLPGGTETNLSLTAWWDLGRGDNNSNNNIIQLAGSDGAL